MPDTVDDLKNAIIDNMFKCEKNKILEKKLFIFDVDGTIKIGNIKIPDIDKFFKKITNMGASYCLLSNNTSKTKFEHVKNISKVIGINFNENSLYTPLDQVIEYLRTNSINNIFVIGTDSVIEYFESNDFTIDEVNPDSVIVTFDTSLNYDKLVTASRLLVDPSIKFILSNIDKRCPTEFGFIPDAGSIADMLRVTTDHEINYTTGKPSKGMIDTILKQKNITRDSCVFFGDRLYTDIRMGNNASIMTVLVLTGETKLKDLSVEDVNDMLILKNYKELL